MTREHLARRDLGIKCRDCGARIDEGDRFVIEPVWSREPEDDPLGFDYRHADCSRTAMRAHIASKAGR